MTYPSCHELSNLDASCNAIQKVGGVASFVYFGSKKDWRDRFIASERPTIRYGSFDDVNFGWLIDVYESETLGNELAKFEGVEYKNSAGFEALPAENVNLFNHNLNMILYWKTQAQLELLQSLLISEDTFAIVCTNSGDIKILGIERGKDYSVLGTETFTDKMGLKSASASGGDIVELQGETGVSVVMQAVNLLNPPYFLVAIRDNESVTDYSTYSEMVAQLDLLCANN
jgi:hypothetical protein